MLKSLLPLDQYARFLAERSFDIGVLRAFLGERRTTLLTNGNTE